MTCYATKPDAALDPRLALHACASTMPETGNVETAGAATEVGVSR